MSTKDNFDAVIIGAGFAGIYALYKIRGLGLKVKAYERASDVGGTWFSKTRLFRNVALA